MFKVGATCGSLIVRAVGFPAKLMAYLITGTKYVSGPISRKEYRTPNPDMTCHLPLPKEA
jgi:hypothetical protein